MLRERELHLCVVRVKTLPTRTLVNEPHMTLTKWVVVPHLGSDCDLVGAKKLEGNRDVLEFEVSLLSFVPSSKSVTENSCEGVASTCRLVTIAPER